MAFRKLCRYFSVPLAVVLGMQGVAMAGPFDCCQSHCCPPCTIHCTEGPPRIKFKCACPRPICCPCDRPGWGYFQPCWVPWPYPPDWSHCPVPPPASTVIPGPQNQTRTESAPGTPAPPPQFDIRPGL